MSLKTIKIPNEAAINCLDQGRTNGCGTACIAMIFTYLLGKEVTQQQMDREIRRMNIFTSPGDILRLAKKHRLNAAAYNNSDPAELEFHLQEGRPVQALIRSARGLHYIVVTGVEDHSNVDKRLICLDPATGMRTLIPEALFLKAWADLPASFNNFFIAYSKEPSSLPSCRLDNVALTMKVLDGVTQVTNSLHSLLFPPSAKTWINNVIQLPIGLVQAILCAPIAIFGIALKKVRML